MGIPTPIWEAKCSGKALVRRPIIMWKTAAQPPLLSRWLSRIVLRAMFHGQRTTFQTSKSCRSQLAGQ